MTKQIVGLFDTVSDAEATVRDLKNIGISNADISFVGNNSRGEYDESGNYVGSTEGSGLSEVTTGAGVGATSGAVIGGLAGVLVGLGALAIPGIGPVLAAGPFAAAIGSATAAVGAGALGAGIGAATGGLLGALVGAGIPEEDANLYAEGLRRGGTLVLARVNDDELDQALDVMERHNVVDIDDRAQEFRAEGWTHYDETADPYDLSTRNAGVVRAESAGGAQAQPRTRRRARSYESIPTGGGSSEGRVDGSLSSAGHATERSSGADLGSDAGVGRRDTRDNY